LRRELESIRTLRKENNDNWMRLVDLALEYVPAEKINPVIEAIGMHDSAITRLWWDLRK
jgi:hypothetical protein